MQHQHQQDSTLTSAPTSSTLAVTNAATTFRHYASRPDPNSFRWQDLLGSRDVMAEEQLRKEMLNKGKFLGELDKRFGTRVSNSSTASG